MRVRSRHDRHARFRRAVVDGRRRPVDGFRTTSAGRFDRLVDEVLATLPADLRGHLDDVHLAVEDVPDASPDGEVPLGQLATEVGRLTLYRRPLEARARDRVELTELVRLTVVHELADHLGFDDDQLDELGWT